MKDAGVILRYRLRHIIFWALVFGIWYFLRVDDYSSPVKAAVITLIKVADLALMIYVTNYVLVPRLLYKKKYLLFALVFIVMIAASCIIKMYVIGNYMNSPALYIHNWSAAWKTRVYDNVLPHFFLVIAGAAIKLLFDYRNLQQRMVETAKEKAEAELNFLKSQINPHFLFNSLNSVYFLIDKENVQARTALHRFSEMLRYQLYELQEEKIPIEKEVVYLKDYIALQQLRHDEKYSVDFNMDGEVRDFKVEPLLLIPFVENAFKHISHKNDKVNYISVNMSRVNGSLFFSVENSNEKGQAQSEKTGGIGIANVKRRLELLYPGKHNLQIEESPETYKVSLELQIV